MAPGSAQHILSDCRVLDFTQYLAGPTVTRLMAELGAQIVKIEQAPIGDPSRILPYLKNGRSGYFIQQNRGKQSLCLDFDRPEAQEIIRDLVGEVDIVVENFGPGVLRKRGLDYDSLREINPRLIMASVSAFGQTGPLSHRTGYDYIAQAFSGFTHMTGYPDQAPVLGGFCIADIGSGVHAFGALGYALYHRERTGMGQHIDIAMVDALFHMHEIAVHAHALSEGAYVPTRMGAHHEMLCPCGIFKSAEGHIALIVADRQWPGLVRAMGQPELERDPRFATVADRGKNQRELIAIIEQWLQSLPSDEAALQLFDEHRVPAGPVLSVVEAMNHPHYRARNMVRTVPDPILGAVTIPGFPFKFSAMPDLPEIQAPLLGEHGPGILRDWLGFPEARIEQLKRDGVLHLEPK